jgi:AraC-like DNA-binding protein
MLSNAQKRSLVQYIDSLCTASRDELASHLQTKNTYIKKSPFNKGEWEDFFSETHTSWNFLKKFIRIKRAMTLMEEGFLEEGSIEELAQEVGYATRASLYLAFRQIMGVALPDYRDQHMIK